MSIDRATALAELSDPATPAGRLAELAHAHPDLGTQVVAHPNVYPDLVDWVHQYGAVAPAPSPAVAPTTTLPRWLLPTAIGVGGLAVAATVTVAALIIPALVAPPTTGASPDAAAPLARPAGDYLLGAELAWTATGAADLAAAGTSMSQIGGVAADGTWIVSWPTDLAGSGRASSTSLLAIDPDDGVEQWRVDGLWLRQCADLAVDGRLVCIDESDLTVRVIDAASGETVETGLSGRSAQSVAVTGSAVYLADEQMDDSGHDEAVFVRTDLDGGDAWEVRTACEYGAPPSAGAGQAARVVVDDGLVRAASTCAGVLLDPSDGSTVEVAPEGVVYGGTWFAADGLLRLGSVAFTGGDTLSGVQGSQGDLTTLWEIPLPDSSGMVTAIPMGEGDDAPLLLADGGTGAFTRVDPALAGARVDSMPRALPDCPDGWAPVAWTAWDGGATLVCRAGAALTVLLVRGDDVRTSTSATRTPGGYRADVDGMEVEIGFDGWLVWIDGEEASASTAGWSSARGELSYPDAIGIAACPPGTFALSLSVWDGGWLLTCGELVGGPSRFIYLDGSGEGTGGALTWASGRYCGETDDGVPVCVSVAPALVQFGADDTLVQHSVIANAFGARGTGGSGQGTGAYGVEAPRATADAQVGYLVAILERSAAARSTVNAVLAPLNACAVSDGDVQALRDLTQARTDLLTALRSTPVDQVPDGGRLLALLTHALVLSEQADQGYVDAGTLMRVGDCANGRSTYTAAIGVANQAEAAKQAFVDAWNASMPGAFGVRTFTAKDI